MLERASLLAWPRVSIPFITTAVKLIVLWVDWVSELNVCLLTTLYPWYSAADRHKPSSTTEMILQSLGENRTKGEGGMKYLLSTMVFWLLKLYYIWFSVANTIYSPCGNQTFVAIVFRLLEHYESNLVWPTQFGIKPRKWSCNHRVATKVACGMRHLLLCLWLLHYKFWLSVANTSQHRSHNHLNDLTTKEGGIGHFLLSALWWLLVYCGQQKSSSTHINDLAIIRWHLKKVAWDTCYYIVDCYTIHMI